jgi:amidase
MLAIALLASLMVAAFGGITSHLSNFPSHLCYSVFPLEQNTGNPDLSPMPLCNGFKLVEATIDQMQVATECGQMTSQQLVVCYMQRMYQTESYIK